MSEDSHLVQVLNDPANSVPWNRALKHLRAAAFAEYGFSLIIGIMSGRLDGEVGRLNELKLNASSQEARHQLTLARHHSDIFQAELNHMISAYEERRTQPAPETIREDAPIKHNVPTNTPRTLDMTRSELNGTQTKTLIDLITLHIHPIIQSQTNIKYDENYGLASGVLELGYKSANSLQAMQFSRTKPIVLEQTSSVLMISGYELVRLKHRFNGRARYDLQAVVDKLHISPIIIERLLKERLIVSYGDYITISRFAAGGSQLNEFYEKIFPTKNSARYFEVMELLKSGLHPESPTTEFVVAPPSSNRAAPSDVNVLDSKTYRAEWPYKKFEGHPLPEKEIGLKENVHYECIDDKVQNPDARKIRRINNLTGMVDLRDAFRLQLAVVYQSRKEVIEHIGINPSEFKEAEILRKLETAGTTALFYGGEIVFPQGTAAIARLDAGVIVRVGNLIKRLIEEYGPFVGKGHLRKIFGEDFNESDFNKQVSYGKIAKIEIRGSTRYNLFQIGVYYEGLLRRRLG